MDSLQSRKLRQRLVLVMVPVVLLGMIAYNALRPSDTQADQLSEMSQSILSTDWENVTPEQREAFRQQFQNLPPEMRRQIFLEVSKKRIEQIRQDLAQRSPEERSALIQDRIQVMRREQEGMSAKERGQVRERIQSDEGREMIRTVMEMYMNEFTARERAELDPLVHEWLAQLERISGR